MQPTDTGSAQRVNLATLTVLKNSAWFKGIADELLREIAALSVTRQYTNGETVFERDEPGDYLFGVIAGRKRPGKVSAILMRWRPSPSSDERESGTRDVLDASPMSST